MIANLQNPILINLITEMKEDFYNEYQEVASLNPDFGEKCSFDTYSRCRIMYMSRRFSYTTVDKEFIACLCPMADMLNHGASETIREISTLNTAWYFTPYSGGYMMKATKNITRGEEIRDNYGDTPCFNMFLSYGFYIDEIAHVKEVRL